MTTAERAAGWARAILDPAVRRTPINDHDGRSGATLARLRLPDGRRMVLKRLDPASDLGMQVTDDPDGREHLLWRDGVLGALPAGLGHAVLAAWPDPPGASLLMRDVSAYLAPGRISRDQCRRIFTAAARMHATFAGRTVQAACPLVTRVGLFAPARMRAYLHDGYPLPGAIVRGWEIFAETVPADVAEAVLGILDHPERLAEPLAANGVTFIHGDLWLSNIALEPHQVTLLDWALASHAPPAVEFASFLAGNAYRVDAGMEDLLDLVRAACGPRHHEPTLRLALLGGLVEMGWDKALDLASRPHPATRADLDWWVGRAREALELGLIRDAA